tara:strand:- start:6 stop:314 length:309 start_codon:yes stop_codon:yes gene_type:complete
VSTNKEGKPMYKTIDDIIINTTMKHKVLFAKVNFTPAHKDDLPQGACIVETPSEYVAWTIHTSDNGKTFDACWGHYSNKDKSGEAFEKIYKQYLKKVSEIPR